VSPARRGAKLVVEERAGGRWSRVLTTTVGSSGAYRVGVPHAGTYRVRYGAVSGPAVRVR